MAFGAALLAIALLHGPLQPPVARTTAALRPAADHAVLHGGVLEVVGLVTGPERPPENTPPPCLAGVCQPVVAVPGFEPRFERAHRSEALVLALQRANVEPLASLTWALVSTGLRLDWSPPVLEGPDAHARGWGSLMLRLRVRIDAENRLIFPKRPPS